MGLTTILTIGFILFLGALILVMLVIQARHKAFAERRQKILHLNTQNKKLKHIQRTLLPQFKSNEIDDFIYQSLIQNYQLLIKLNHENAAYIKSDLEAVIQEREARKKREKAPPASLTLEAANISRSTLKTLYETVKDSYEKKRIVKSEAEKLVQQVENFMMMAAIQFYKQQIEDYRKKRQFREASQLSQKLLDTMKSSKRREQYNQEIISAKANLKKIQEEWKSAKNKQKEVSGATLMDSMDNWLDEEHEWKKDAGYD